MQPSRVFFDDEYMYSEFLACCKAPTGQDSFFNELICHFSKCAFNLFWGIFCISFFSWPFIVYLQTHLAFAWRISSFFYTFFPLILNVGSTSNKRIVLKKKTNSSFVCLNNLSVCKNIDESLKKEPGPSFRNINCKLFFCYRSRSVVE